MGFLRFFGQLCLFGLAVFSIFVALLFSGKLAQWGAIRLASDALASNFGRYDLVGMTPAYYPDGRLPFVHADIPELGGKLALVTGANSGVGYATALHLARRGAHVVIVCRSESRCRAAADEMNGQAALGGRVDYALADFTDLASVDAMARDFARRHDKLDILVHNAGIPGPLVPHALTVDGHEKVWQVNHLAGFLINKHLQPLLEAAAAQPGAVVRVVFVSSAANFDPHPDPRRLTDLRLVNDPTDWNGFKYYGLSKLMNIMFAQELSRRTAANVIVTAAHPGLVDTHIWDVLIPELRPKVSPFVWTNLLEPFINTVRKQASWTSDDGALTQIFLATKAGAEHDGRYFHPVVVPVPPHKFATTDGLAAGLWAMSEQALAQSGF